MDSQKLDNELQLALSLPENVREESLDLDVGYNATEERWTLIVRYIGDIEAAAGAMAAAVCRPPWKDQLLFSAGTERSV